jgi:hypothetical protein
MNEINEILNELALLELSESDRQAYNEQEEAFKPMFLSMFRDKLEKKMRAESLKRVLARRYDNYFSQIIEDANSGEITKTLTELKSLEKEKEAKNGEYVFITIAPVENTNLDNFIKKLYDITKLSYYTKYLFVIEQRGENEEELGKGMHAHILAHKGKYKLSHCKRDAERVMQKKPSIESNINCQYRTGQGIKNTQTYMVGKKDDPAKWLKQQHDVIFREKKDLKPYYGCLFD